MYWTSHTPDQTVILGNKRSSQVVLLSFNFGPISAFCEHLTAVCYCIGNQFPKRFLKNNNNIPQKYYLVPKWGKENLAVIVSCRQSSCLSGNPCCHKPKCFYFGSFSRDDPDCCCYNNNTSMFNSLQCRDNASDSHTEMCMCVCLCACVCVWGWIFVRQWQIETEKNGGGRETVGIFVTNTLKYIHKTPFPLIYFSLLQSDSDCSSFWSFLSRAPNPVS